MDPNQARLRATLYTATRVGIDHMPRSKTATMANAISRVESGDSIAAGLALEHAIPFAAGHEFIRQGTNNALVGSIGTVA